MPSYSQEVTSESPGSDIWSPAEFSHSVARLGEESWHRILDEFHDASIFQTSAFCAAGSNSERLEHLVVQRGADVVAAAQVRLIPVPLTNKLIAYVLWGPLIQHRSDDQNYAALREALRVLRQEYVVNRKCCLRIKPPAMLGDQTPWHAALTSEGYLNPNVHPVSRTILIDLARPLDEIRKGMDKKWRNCLSAAEKNSLNLQEGSDDAMFDVFFEVYREMLSRKRLAEPGDIRRFRAMQAILPCRHKMRIFIARDDLGSPCAGAVCSATGRRGIFLFGATAERGMRNKSSYLVQWRVIQWLKELGCVEYDLHGSNAESNPGVYAFKMGLCGKNGREVAAPGSFEIYDGPATRAVLWMADHAKAALRRLKAFHEKRRGFQG